MCATGTASQDGTEDPARMSPGERVTEVAAIIAQGVLRLHMRAAAAPEDSAESCHRTHDSGCEPSPHVSVVSTGREAEKGDRDT
jgi:hypothetical protein